VRLKQLLLQLYGREADHAEQHYLHNRLVIRYATLQRKPVLFSKRCFLDVYTVQMPINFSSNQFLKKFKPMPLIESGFMRCNISDCFFVFFTYDGRLQVFS
jgi:hypothetical protein